MKASLCFADEVAGRVIIYLFIMCSVNPYKVDIELVKVNVTYSYKWEIKL